MSIDGWVASVVFVLLLLGAVGAYHVIGKLLEDNCDPLVAVAFRGVVCTAAFCAAYYFVCGCQTQVIGLD